MPQGLLQTKAQENIAGRRRAASSEVDARVRKYRTVEAQAEEAEVLFVGTTILWAQELAALNDDCSQVHDVLLAADPAGD